MDFYDQNGTRKGEQFEPAAAAPAFRVEIEGQLGKGTYRPEAAKVTVKEVPDLFLKHCEARKARREKRTA